MMLEEISTSEVSVLVMKLGHKCGEVSSSLQLKRDLRLPLL
jgi:hypothetical protein